MISNKLTRNIVATLALLLAGCANDNTEISTYQGAFEKTYPSWKSLQGQWVIINYWATWCSPCREEIPELNQLSLNPQFTVLGINFDSPATEQLGKDISTMAVGFPTLLADPALKLGYSRPGVLPTTIIIDPQGQVTEILVGPQTESTITAVIRR